MGFQHKRLSACSIMGCLSAGMAIGVQVAARPDPAATSFLFFLIWAAYLGMVTIGHMLAIALLIAGISVDFRRASRWVVGLLVLVLVVDIIFFFRVMP